MSVTTLFRPSRAEAVARVGNPTRNTLYRPDIDGLRAIAISSVVLAHAEMPGLAGGYLGVDVFFVISGYLITGILLKDYAQGKPSLIRFYERRVRRIVPALAVVLIAVCLGALALFSPYELKRFAGGLIAAITFVANLFFMAGTDYCAPRFYEPLLHLWSLGVEEQFYIAFPFFLWWLLRRPQKRRWRVLAIVSAISLAISVAFADLIPKNAFDDLIAGFQTSATAFYFTGSRAWELLLGAMIALRASETAGATVTQHWPRWAVEAAAFLALSAIVVPVFLNARDTAWPGVHALLPCLGSATLIYLHSRNKSAVGYLLSTPPMTGLGLISYSLYLWHWPLFEFYRRWNLRSPAITDYLVLILIAVVLAYLSWRFVERPFRGSRSKFDRPSVFRAAAVSGGVFACLGLVVVIAGGIPQRFPSNVQAAYAALDGSAARVAEARGPRCYVRNHDPDYSFDRCFRLAADKPNIVVWGDSFVGNYFYGMREAGLETGVNVIEASHFDCRPVLDETLVPHKCAAFNRSVLAHLDGRVSAVVISTRLFNHQDLVPSVLAVAREVAKRGIHVVVIGASLEYRDPEPFYVARYIETKNAEWLDSRRFLKPGLAEFDHALQAQFRGEQGVKYISVLDSVCPDRRCPMMVGLLPTQSDFGHLTIAASRAFGAALWPQVRSFGLFGNIPGRALPAAIAVNRHMTENP